MLHDRYEQKPQVLQRSFAAFDHGFVPGRSGSRLTALMSRRGNTQCNQHDCFSEELLHGNSSFVAKCRPDQVQRRSSTGSITGLRNLLTDICSRYRTAMLNALIPRSPKSTFNPGIGDQASCYYIERWRRSRRFPASCKRMQVSGLCRPGPPLPIRA